MSLTLVVEQKVSPSETIYTDTLKCTLTDEHGNNKGQGLSYHQFTFPHTHTADLSGRLAHDKSAPQHETRDSARRKRCGLLATSALSCGRHQCEGR